MILKRILMPLFVMGIIIGLSSVAHAQTVTCSAGATPVPRATATGHTEPTGDYIVTCTSPAGATGTTQNTLQIDYGVSITNSTSHPPGRGINTINCSNTGFTTTFTCGTLGSAGLTVSSTTSGTINVVIPAFGACGLAGGCSTQFTVMGVLVSLAGTGKSSVAATLSVATPGNGVLVNGATDTATVISTVLAGIANPIISPTPGTAVIASNGTSFDTTFGIDVAENYVDMFRTANQFNCASAATYPLAAISTPACGGNIGVFPQAVGSVTQLKVAFANIPSGAAITGCSASAKKADGSASTLIVSATGVLSSTTVDATNPNITITFDGAGDLASVETVTLTCTGFSVGTATLPFTGGNITATVTLAPTGSALGAVGAVNTSTTSGQVPRYASTPLPATALTVVTVVPATTNMLVAFAVAGPGFDTGIALSNTTADPFGVTSGGANPTNGTIVYTFFPNGGTSFSFTTGAAGTPTGNGGLTSGVLNAGNTYSVLVSELLKAAGKGPAFSGYIFITTNFTNAHGVAFAVSNFDGKFTSAVPVLVLPAPAGFSRQAPGGGAEQLDQ